MELCFPEYLHHLDYYIQDLILPLQNLINMKQNYKLNVSIKNLMLIGKEFSDLMKQRTPLELWGMPEHYKTGVAQEAI